jgi:hypothetical protein
MKRGPASLVSAFLTAVAVVSGVVLIARFAWFSDVALAADPEASVLVGLQSALIGIAWVLCGLIVVWRTDNRVGWLLIAVGLCFGLTWIGWAIWALVRIGEPVGGAARVVGAMLESAWFPAMVLSTVVLPVLFPTGRLPSPRSRVILVLGGLALAAFVAHLTTHLVSGTYLEAFGDDDTGVFFMFAPLLLGIMGSVASLVGRFRRSEGVVRQQIKWVVAALSVVGLVIILLFGDVFNRIIGPTWSPLVSFAAFGLVPVAISLAILRYRLYDIERIVSRTVAYALVVALLAGVFFGLIVGVQALLPAQSALAVAASTLAVAALFNPLRGRVQVLVDRRFNRSKYDAQAEIDALSVRLRDAHDRDDITREMIQVIGNTMQPSTVGIWVREG